jgi:hypothetical protein
VLYERGQVLRVSELFGLECENGPSSARGFYVYNNYIFYLIRHHKRRGRLIENSTSPATYQHVRVELFTTISSTSGSLAGCSNVKDGTTSQNTAARFYSALIRPLIDHGSLASLQPFQRASSQVWGWAMNAQLCRQLTIAITERYRKCISGSIGMTTKAQMQR